jgi:hypothetical protein
MRTGDCMPAAIAQRLPQQAVLLLHLLPVQPQLWAVRGCLLLVEEFLRWWVSQLQTWRQKQQRCQHLLALQGLLLLAESSSLALLIPQAHTAQASLHIQM